MYEYVADSDLEEGGFRGLLQVIDKTLKPFGFSLLTSDGSA